MERISAAGAAFSISEGTACMQAVITQIAQFKNPRLQILHDGRQGGCLGCDSSNTSGNNTRWEIPLYSLSAPDIYRIGYVMRLVLINNHQSRLDRGEYIFLLVLVMFRRKFSLRQITVTPRGLNNVAGILLSIS
jgi:hypothetical protein